jgi:hypothetical protein
MISQSRMVKTVAGLNPGRAISHGQRNRVETMIDGRSNNPEATATPAPSGESPRPRSESGPATFRPSAAFDRLRTQPCRSRYKLVERSPWELDPHSILVKHGIRPSATRLSAIAESSDPLNLDPIFISPDGKILKGLEECKFARMMNIEKVLCLEHDLDEEGQIRWILEHNRKREHLNDFVRIELALELKSIFRERARDHMQSGGVLKGSMNLPKTERIDCREKIADAAGVADDQVSKVEEILQKGNSTLFEALRSGEVKIHRASCWLRSGEPFPDQLALYRAQLGTSKAVNLLLRRHQSKPQATQEILDIRRIGGALTAMDSARRANVVVASIRAPGQFLLLSEQLLHNLQTQGELHYEPD